MRKSPTNRNLRPKLTRATHSVRGTSFSHLFQLSNSRADLFHLKSERIEIQRTFPHDEWRFANCTANPNLAIQVFRESSITAVTASSAARREQICRISLCLSMQFENQSGQAKSTGNDGVKEVGLKELSMCCGEETCGCCGAF